MSNLIAVETATGDHVSQSAVSKVVKDAAIEMVTEPKMSTIAVALTKNDELLSSNVTLVATAVKQDVRKVKMR